MTKLVRLSSCAVFCALLAAPPGAAGDDSTPHTRACIEKAKGPYGFQCHGSAFNGAIFEPVTFVGTVEADDDAVYEGFGTFSSSNGSASTHVKGKATFGRHCFGHVDYTTNEILLPGGGTIPLPPAAFDFAVVDDGREILGTGVAAPGVTGDFVPRLTCRLVKIRR